MRTHTEIWIAIYDAREDYDSILDLEAEVDAEDLKNKDKILDLFADYMTSAPLITDPEGDVPSGKYDEAARGRDCVDRRGCHLLIRSRE